MRLRILSDAPPGELSVTPSVEIGPRLRNPDAVSLTAVADDREGEAPATYNLEIQGPLPLAPGWAYDLSRAKMQVTVLDGDSGPGEDSASFGCHETSLLAVAHRDTRDAGSWMRALYGEELREYISGEILVRSAHPKAVLSLLSPYRRPFAHDEEEEAERPTDRPYPFGFLIDLGSRDFANGFERTLSLAWFDDLEVRVETPGCDALEAVCTAAACRLR